MNVMSIGRLLMLSRGPRAVALAAAVLVCALVAGASTAARAQVRVEGTIAAVRIDATRASLADVLSALGAALHTRYRTAIALQDEISGTYTGPFRQVIARLLAGYDYVLKSDRDVIEVLVIGRRGERAVIAKTPQAPASGLAANPATLWRGPPAR